MNELQYQIDMIGAMNEKLKNEQKMMEMIINTSTSAFVYYSYQHDDLRTLGCFDNYFSFRIKRIGELQRIIDAVDSHYRDEVTACLSAENRGETRCVVEAMLSDSRKWIEFEVTVVYDDSKRPTDKIIRMRDVTKANLQNEELSYMAYYDLNTGLYNRNYFIKLLNDMVSRAKEEARRVAIMFVDIDDFRRINDGMGIVVGDELLMMFGQFLGTLSAENDNVIVSHFSGDLYCVGIFDPKGTYSVENLYQCIRRRTAKPFKTSDGHEITINITVGVAQYPDASDNALDLINCAEIVMMRSKQGGKDAIQYFDSDILSEFLRNIEVENKLREAVFDMNFVMNYQPQYKAHNDELRGVEALIRWRDPDKGMISPAVFIPIAEKNGTIVSIGQWVIEESIKTYMQWRKQYDKAFTLSINISAIQYKREDFVEKIVQVIEKYNMNPEELELEITETALIDNYRDVIGKLTLLREYGVKISMDDFGTGYSSLSYLKNLPIDTLKIDKTFVDTVLEDANSIIILESIMYMVKRLGLETVAEGVESTAQYDYLKNIGCDNIQGFLLGKPQSSEEIEKLLQAQG